MLVGIKDTNDQLVAATLRSLADLVPILGSSIVIGGKRAKLFNDGRPINHPIKSIKRNRRNSKPIDLDRSAGVGTATEPNSIENEINQALPLPERPQPDGEEVDTSTEEIEQSAEEDLDNWEDWDVNENGGSDLQSSRSVTAENSNQTLTSESVATSLESSQQSSNQIDSSENLSLTGISLIGNKKKLLPDISELDIKNQRSGCINGSNEFNFFQDMEPVIESSTKYLVTENKSEDGYSTSENVKTNNLGVAHSELNEDGWGEEEWD